MRTSHPHPLLAVTAVLLLATAGGPAACGQRGVAAQKEADSSSVAGALNDPGVVTPRSDGTVASPAHD